MRYNTTLCRTLGIAVTTALLAACASNGGSQIPHTNQASLPANVLQLAVGTANIGQDKTVGLNVVATLRQRNGLSGVLADTPTLTGPAGFTLAGNTPSAYNKTNVDAGTAHISGSAQVPLNNAGLVQTTLGTFTGVFSYGFGPFNSDQTITSGAYFPGNPNNSGGNGFTSSIYDGSSLVAAVTKGGDATLPQPLFSADAMDYLVGPPAVPFFNDGTFPLNFAGYLPGFTVFELPPAAGNYSLNVNVAAQNVAPITYNASATLNSTATLGSIPVPTFTGDGKGGGSGTVVVPSGVTETMVYVVDADYGSAGGGKSPTFYAVGPLTGTGTLTFTLPDNLGKCNGSGCQNGSNATPSITTGDTYLVAATGYDYPAFEAGPPGNTQQKPTIAGANGQADITMSPVLSATY